MTRRHPPDSDAVRAVSAGLAALPNQQRQLLTMACRQRMSCQEIAAATNATVDAVKQNLHNITRTLRSTLPFAGETGH